MTLRLRSGQAGEEQESPQSIVDSWLERRASFPHGRTAPHPRCDGKSAEARESKGVALRPLGKRVRRRQKGKRLDGKVPRFAGN